MPGPSYQGPSMDMLRTLRDRIPQFPGYSLEEDRRRSDELIRSFLGEALALLQARLAPSDAATRELFEDLIIRAGFRNQIAFKAFEYAVLDGARVREISGADLRMIELADHAAQIDVAALPSFLNDVRAAFDARDIAMESTAA